MCLQWECLLLKNVLLIIFKNHIIKKKNGNGVNIIINFWKWCKKCNGQRIFTKKVDM